MHWNNCLAFKVAFLTEVCLLFAIFTIIEQPLSSSLFDFPRMLLVKKRHGDQFLEGHTYLGAYDAPSEKGLKLKGTDPAIAELWLPRPNMQGIELVNKKIRDDGTVAVSGNANTKASQAYPRRFGLQVAYAHLSRPKHILPDARSMGDVKLSRKDQAYLLTEPPRPNNIW